MDEQISRSDLADAVESLRRVLAAVDAGELSCSPAYRNRSEGAVVALESLAEVSGTEDTPESRESRK